MSNGKSLSNKQKQKIQDILLISPVEEIYQLVLDGTLNRFPSGFWLMPGNYDYAERCLRYLIERVLKWSDEEVKQNINTALLAKYKLSTPRVKLYGSLHKYLDAAYPGKFHPWELAASTPPNYWCRETKIEAVKWYYTEKHKWDRDFVMQTFGRNYLATHLAREVGKFKDYFDSNFEFLNAVFPGEFQPVELYINTRNREDNELKVEALRWLFTEKYPYDRRFILENYSTDFIKTNHLSKLIRKNTSIYELINRAFPEEHFKPWEFISVPINYWNGGTVRGALRYLLLEKYKVDAEHINSVINYKVLTLERLTTVVTRYGIASLLTIAESILKEQLESENQ